MVSDTCALLEWVVVEVEGRSRAAALKGLMTYAFTQKGNFLLLLLLAIEIWILWLRFGPVICYLGQEAGICVMRKR